MAKITVSLIKADIGSLAGHTTVHPDCLESAKNSLKKGKEDGTIIDYHVTHAGDDLELIMTHRRGENNEKVHKLAWTPLPKQLKFRGNSSYTQQVKIYSKTHSAETSKEWDQESQKLNSRKEQATL